MKKAIAALKGVAPIIQEAIRCHLSGDAMRWPDPMEDPGPASAAEKCCHRRSAHRLWAMARDPNGDHGPVRRAIPAWTHLPSELDGQAFEPEFYEWFENKVRRSARARGRGPSGVRSSQKLGWPPLELKSPTPST